MKPPSEEISYRVVCFEKSSSKQPMYLREILVSIIGRVGSVYLGTKSKFYDEYNATNCSNT